MKELNKGYDTTLEVENELLQNALKNGFTCTTNVEELKECNYYIVTVPTPVDSNNHPVLLPLIKASETVGEIISKGDIVIY